MKRLRPKPVSAYPLAGVIMAALQRPGDILFLGHSESLYRVSDQYELVGRTIYRRIDA